MTLKIVVSAVLVGAALMGCNPKQASTTADVASIPDAETAEDTPLNCKPASGVFGFLAAVGVYDAWDDRPIEPLTIAKFTPTDGKALPLKLIYRFAGQDFEMPVADDGTLVLEYSALDPDDGGELCVLDPARVGDPPGGLDLGINTEFVFKRNPAGYSLEALDMGAELTTAYTSRIIQQSTGADINPVLGEATWLNLRQPSESPGKWKVPKHVFMKGDQVVAPPKIDVGEDYIQFSMADAKAQGADRWVISGKDYVLSAVFNPKTIPENYKDILGVK